MKSYYENFETLCDGLIFQYEHNRIWYENLRNRIESVDPFKSVKLYDKSYRQDIGEKLSYFYRKILQQPFWYLESVFLFTDELELSEKELTLKRAQYLRDNIELATDKFRQVKISIKDNFDILVHNDKQSAQLLFEEFLFVVNNILKFLPHLSYHETHFNYEKSPLLIVLMELVREIRNRAGSAAPYYDEIEEYLSNIDQYKKLFDNSIEPIQNAGSLDNALLDKLINNEILMKQLPQQILQKYSNIFDKLMNAINPELMLRELKEDGFKYVTEDFLLIVDSFLFENERLIIGLTVSNPDKKPDEIGIPNLKLKSDRATLVRALIEKQNMILQQDKHNSDKKNETHTVEKKVKENSMFASPIDHFIDELFKLEIKQLCIFHPPSGYIVKFPAEEVPFAEPPNEIHLSLEHYFRKNSEYEYQLKQLQQFAITDLLKLDDSQIQRQLKRFKSLQSRFYNFWKWFSSINGYSGDTDPLFRSC